MKIINLTKKGQCQVSNMNDEKKKTNAEYYGDTKHMPKATLNERVRKAHDDLVELNTEITRRANFTDAQRLADRLHHLLHIGVDCDYFYSDWPGPLTSCREDFLILAERSIRWFESVADEKRTADYPLGQLLALLETTRFGQSGMWNG